jgi:hypothetical protein
MVAGDNACLPLEVVLIVHIALGVEKKQFKQRSESH